MKVFAVLALCFVATNAKVAPAPYGVVNTTSCGGAGTFVQMRIPDCEGTPCRMTPGIQYPCEGDFFPSRASHKLHLKVTATFLGFPITIVDVDLDNSSVQPGVLYTIRFPITPNDILSEYCIPVFASVTHAEGSTEEFCRRLEVCITLPNP